MCLFLTVSTLSPSLPPSPPLSLYLSLSFSPLRVKEKSEDQANKYSIDNVKDEQGEAAFVIAPLSKRDGNEELQPKRQLGQQTLLKAN